MAHRPRRRALRARRHLAAVDPRRRLRAHPAGRDFTTAEPTLAAYDALLAAGDSDYIGTRLHGGVRALETGAWGVIVAVDNRALEISRDTGLPVHARGERDAIRATVERRAPLDVRLPYDQITAWKAQLPVAG